MKKNLLLCLSILFIPIIFLSCLDATESEYEQQVREDDEAIRNYLESNNIEAERQTSGVYTEIVVSNADGKQIMEDHVAGILYRMTHMEGEYDLEVHSDTLNPLRFSNSYSFTYNAIHPAGLNYEIGSMREGEKFRFYVPSYQAFGNYNHDDMFDSFSNFIIEVDLIEVKTEEEIYDEELNTIKNYLEINQIETESYPNGLFYTSIEEGDGETPGSNSQVEFHFTRRYLDGTIIETSEEDDPIQVNLNDNRLVRGLEEGISLMRENEKAVLIMPSKMAFGKSVQVIPQKLRAEWADKGDIEPLTRPYASVIYEIDLIKVD